MKVRLKDLKSNSYKLFEGTFENLKEEFDKRNIKIGDGVSISDGVFIGKKVTIKDRDCIIENVEK